jgi:uncharacterized protein YxjI
MAILATCTCGQSYDLKDGFAGVLMQCPSCGNQFQAGVGGSATGGMSDPVFARDKYLLRQKHFSISQKYYVWDERGQNLLFVLRPAHFARNLLAGVCGLGAGVITLMVGLVAAAAMSDAVSEAVGVIVGLLGFAAALLAAIFIGTLISKKRHVLFYRDESLRELMLEVKQDQKFVLFNATFTLCDASGQELGRFQKNYLYNIFRKRWRYFNQSGQLQYVAKEDSIILSLLRRLLGPLFGLLRTNYIILDADERLVGEFNRKFTLLDRYVLDLTRDSARVLDRRVAVALGVMLDTGERR